MTHGDIPGAIAAFDDAFAALRAGQGLPHHPRTPADLARLSARMGHFMATDPGGSFVAVLDDQVVGLSQAFVRERHWMLSLLAVAPPGQGSRTGHGLLEAALAHRDRSGPGSIQCSRDPRAMALYTRAGFDLNPSVRASGPLRTRPMAPSSVRPGNTEDLDLVATVDRRVRGAARNEDVAFAIEQPGCKLFVDEAGGYALAIPTAVVALAALNDSVATGLLLAVLADTAPGEDVEVNWLTAPQGWAIRVAVDCGLALHPHGPMMTRAMPGPPAPYIASGGLG
jgi:GNAT superfamily N-acetyltransferase